MLGKVSVSALLLMCAPVYAGDFYVKGGTSVSQPWISPDGEDYSGKVGIGPDGHGVYFGGGATWQVPVADTDSFNVSFGIIVGFDRYEFDDKLGLSAGSIQAYSGGLEVGASYPLDDYFYLYAGAGAGASYLDLHDVANVNSGDVVPYVSGGGGIGVRISEDVSVNLGYEYRYFFDGAIENEDKNGSVDPNLTAHSIRIGITYEF